MIYVTGRNLKVDYYEKEDELWVAESRIVDEQHDISLITEIDMSEMVIISAEIKFARCPLQHCHFIEKKAEQLAGLKVDHDFVRNAMKIFMGAQGCPNIMTLINILIPGIIYYYYPNKIKKGDMTHEQWNKMVRTELNNDCIAHSLL